MSKYVMVLGSSSSDHHGSGEACIPALALLFSPGGREIAVTTGAIPALHEVRVLERFYPEIEEFVDVTTQKLGVSVRVLRCLDRGSLDAGRPRVYSLLTSDDGERLGDGLRWIDAADFCHLGGLHYSQIAAIQRECERVSGPRPESPAVPWEWPGEWESDVREWVNGHIESQYPVEQVTFTPIRSWSVSCVVRVEVTTGTGSERLYFKASPKFFSREAALTRIVAGRFPEFSPRLRAVDVERGWMLMEDLGDLTLGDVDSLDMWLDAMRILARVQLGFAKDDSLLAEVGLERRTTSAILDTLRDWAEGPAELGLRYEAQRTEKALERIVPYLKLVGELCETVDSVALPQTLDHGDLDAGNIFVREGAPVIMDWSDSSISIPFFDAALIPQVSRNPVLADAYLEEWKGYAPDDSQRVAFEASRPIAALERAFHYHRNIVAHLEYPSVDLQVLESYIPDLLNLAADGLERYE